MPATGLWTLAAAGPLAVGLGFLLFNPAPAAFARPTARAADSSGEAGFTAWRGVSSCTSSACHNMDAGRGAHGGDFLKGSEYAMWVGKDPHARANQVLFDPRSVQIEKNLNATRHPERRPPAHQDLLCLRCHVAPEAESAQETAPVWFGDGVGCESCHGAAGGWLAAHVERGWKQMSGAEKAEHGFRNTKDLAVRARTCTDCHVGGDRADVNHDLYAAGHPPLQYEYSSFLDRYRPYQHWAEADDRRRNPAYEAEAWIVGQAVTAQAGLHLLAVRATAAENMVAGKPWPEFAEYDCSSCHHGLEQQRFRTATHANPGTPTWSWFVSMAPLLPEPPPAGALDSLRKKMEQRNPDAAAVADEARALARSYDEWLNRPPTDGSLDAAALRARLAVLTGSKGQETARSGWEEARQVAFAVSAHYRSLEAVEADPQAAAAVWGLERLLRPPESWDTPPAFDGGRVEKALQAIHDRLSSRQ